MKRATTTMPTNTHGCLSTHHIIQSKIKIFQTHIYFNIYINAREENIALNFFFFWMVVCTLYVVRRTYSIRILLLLLLLAAVQLLLLAYTHTHKHHFGLNNIVGLRTQSHGVHIRANRASCRCVNVHLCMGGLSPLVAVAVGFFFLYISLRLYCFRIFTF